ncbi:isocitrate/isopropylmalate family dehydrogenase [Stutzerimonas stutzeri]|nr:isocitrate/isopropylmalate family dehydrogenase [Stutzerimonas stutzeri]
MGIANPISLMLAAAMMLTHVGLEKDALRLRVAAAETLNIDNVRTWDLNGQASTLEFADAVCQRLLAQ